MDLELAFERAGGGDLIRLVFNGKRPTGTEPRRWGSVAEQIIADRVRIALAADMLKSAAGRQARAMRPARVAFETELLGRLAYLEEQLGRVAQIPPENHAYALRVLRGAFSNAFVPLTGAKLWWLSDAAQTERRLLEFCLACLRNGTQNATEATHAHVLSVLATHRKIILRSDQDQDLAEHVGPSAVRMLYLRTWEWARALETRREGIRRYMRSLFVDRFFDITDAQFDGGLDPASA